MQIESRALEGRFVRLEPFTPALKQAVRTDQDRPDVRRKIQARLETYRQS